MARILVTGASGVVGHALVGLLQKAGEVVIPVNGRADVDFESFTQTRALFRYVKPHLVYHLAGAVFGVGGNMAFPGDAIRRNLLINTHVIAAASELGARKIVAMGTTAIYGDAARQPFSENEALHGVPHESERAYAFAKRAMLVMLESYSQQFNLQFAYAIATNMYGAHDRFDARYGHVIPSLISKFAQAEKTPGESVEVWGDGSPTRDFLYAPDAATGLHLLMTEGEGAYNLATGHTHTIRQLVDVIAAQFPNVRYAWDVTKPNGQQIRSYDTSRIRNLGFSLRYDLAGGIAETIDWFRHNESEVRTL